MFRYNQEKNLDATKGVTDLKFLGAVVMYRNHYFVRFWVALRLTKQPMPLNRLSRVSSCVSAIKYI